MGSTETRRLHEFPLFDWLRLAMAMLVVTYHASLITWKYAGDLGVQVFFALSGWLIGSILIEMQRDRLPLFYFNRATRVWIPYFVAVAVLYGLSALRDPFTLRWVEFLIYDVTFTHNWFSLLPERAQAVAEMPLKGAGQHFWSLAVEEQFYLTAPLLVFFMPGGRTTAVWLAVAGVGLAVYPNFAAISLGVAAAATHHRQPGFQLLPSVRLGFVVIALITAPLLMIDSLFERLAPLFAIVVVVLLAQPGKRTKLGVFVGGISYPLYLNHWIGLFVAHGIAKHADLHEPVVQALVGLPGALVIATVAYRLFDLPVLEHRRRWYTVARGRMLGVLAYALVAIGLLVGLSLRVL